MVRESPLENWDQWGAWQAPDPLETGDRGPADWEGVRRDMAARKQRGELAEGGLPHGFMFMRLTYVRGFENVLIDMVTEEPMPDRAVSPRAGLMDQIPFDPKGFAMDADLLATLDPLHHLVLQAGLYQELRQHHCA